MFTENHSLVKNYVLLIKQGLKTFEEVPNYSNLREVVSNVLAQS